jgi:hypothetical protein
MWENEPFSYQSELIWSYAFHLKEHYEFPPRDYVGCGSSFCFMLPYTLHGTRSVTLRLVNSRTIRLSKRTKKKRITRD